LCPGGFDRAQFGAGSMVELRAGLRPLKAESMPGKQCSGVGLHPAAQSLPAWEAALSDSMAFVPAPALLRRAARDKALSTFNTTCPQPTWSWRTGKATISVEHLKRYTTLGMGTDQGKTSNINGLSLMAKARSLDVAQAGTTTFRPPYTPVALGVWQAATCERISSRNAATAMHDWHWAHGGVQAGGGAVAAAAVVPHARRHLVRGL
jgi:sarcosine oxidase subunit alpha